jgi:hypothetical protein
MNHHLGRSGAPSTEFPCRESTGLICLASKVLVVVLPPKNRLRSICSSSHLFEFKGMLDGKAFALGVFLQYPHGFSLSVTGSTVPKVDVVGTYSNEKVQASLTTPGSGLSNAGAVNASAPLLFKGTIGDLNVSGQVQDPTKHGTQNMAGATFTILS